MSDKRKIGILVLMISILIGGFALILATSQQSKKSWSPVFSTYYTDEYGTHAFYRLLEAEGFEVEKNYYRFDKLDQYGLKNYLFIGSNYGIIEDEQKQLLEEINQGANVIYCPIGTLSFFDLIGIHEVQLNDSLSGYLTGEMGVHPAIPDRIFEQMDTIAYLHRENQLDYDIQGMNSLFNYRFQSDSLPIVPLLSSEGDIHAGWVKYGVGKIILISNPYLFTNEGLNQGDNAVFAVSLIRRMLEDHRGTMVFDEFHHGFRMDRISTPLNEPAVRYMVWGLLCTFALAVFSFGLRTMKPVPVLNAPRRTMTEFISSIARLYQRKKEQSHISKEIFHKFRSRVYAALGISQLENKTGYIDLKTRAESKWGTSEGKELLEIFTSIDAMNEQKGKKPVVLVKRIREFSLRNKLDIHV